MTAKTVRRDPFARLATDHGSSHRWDRGAGGDRVEIPTMATLVGAPRGADRLRTCGVGLLVHRVPKLVAGPGPGGAVAMDRVNRPGRCRIGGGLARHRMVAPGGFNACDPTLPALRRRGAQHVGGLRTHRAVRLGPGYRHRVAALGGPVGPRGYAETTGQANPGRCC